MPEIKTSERPRAWLGTPCLICGKTVQISDPGKAPKVCDKCKAAVLKVRKEIEGLKEEPTIDPESLRPPWRGEKGASRDDPPGPDVFEKTYERRKPMPRLIDADDVFGRVAMHGAPNTRYKMGYNAGILHALSRVGESPTIDPESLRPHGRWVWDADGQGYYCSHCPSTVWKSPDVPDAFRHCPSCGAKMDLEEDNA